MQFYKAGIYPHVDPFYIAQSAYIDILHIKPTLPVENFNLCVAFHIGEKVLLAENVYITIQYNTKKKKCNNNSSNHLGR